MHSAPALPPELERPIFELCALSKPNFIPTLMLVAYRVKDWVEPLLYRIFTMNAHRSNFIARHLPEFTPDSLSVSLQRKPHTWFRTTVRHFAYIEDNFFRDPIEQTLIAICLDVEDLFLSSGTFGNRRFGREWVRHVEALPHLRRVTLHLLQEDQLHPFLASFASSSGHYYSSLTHLTLSLNFGSSSDHYYEFPDDLTPDPDSITALTARALSVLPHLTHLSLNGYFITREVNEILQISTLLVIIFNFAYTYYPAWDRSLLTDAVLSDDRVVVISPVEGDYFDLRRWGLGALSGLNGRDYWRDAEEFIEKRRTGEIEAGKHVCPTASDSMNGY
ncbi:hypothetical protein R3P38DRAFT_3172057 [Favolaschia claudopus]|uniref:Uncharacterized protein n=1 Tax=Favolaschia claudopus TaxID=2862362 RepID=A0AAW0DJR5_9AGAR